MEKPQLNLAENPIKLNKFKEYPQKANGISFCAFLLSIFIYISIFYIFNLSPSALFNTPEFWFLISNTLILIIAVDSGAFSSSNDHQDLYEEYVKHSRRSSFSSFELQYYKKSIPQQELEDSEEKKEVIVVHKSEFPENKLEIVLENDSFQENIPEITPKDSNENKIILRRSETENYEQNEEENEFSTMSDDELNRRVEEFIQRFNRQIRLQAAARNFHQN